MEIGAGCSRATTRRGIADRRALFWQLALKDWDGAHCRVARELQTLTQESLWTRAEMLDDKAR